MIKKILLFIMVILGIQNVNAESIPVGEYSYQSDSLVMTIKINNESEMEIHSGDGSAEIEGTKGTYTLQNGKLVYTRIYYNSYNNGNSEWVLCGPDKEVSCGDINETTEEFIYDATSNTISSGVYATRAGRNAMNITLKNSANSTNTTNKCKTNNGIYYGKNGTEVTEEVYNKECINNPQTGSFIPITLFIIGIVISLTILVKTFQSNKFYKI